jgi:YfiH family protein
VPGAARPAAADPMSLVWRPGPPEAVGPDPAWPPVLVAEDLLGAGVVAAFTGRVGGSSAPPFATLNLGLAVGDDLRRVLANRRRVATVLGLAGHPWALARQVHGATILRVGTGRPGAGRPAAGRPQADTVGRVVGTAAARGPWVEAGGLGQGPPEGKAPLGEADGLVSSEAGVVLAVLTADCAPVLLADAEGGVIGAAHAGWRGALDGVLESALVAMGRLGARVSRVRAAVGPTISQRAYEVGPEFLERFADADPEHSRFFVNGAGDRYRFDLPGFVLDRLRAAGVAEAGWIGACTYADPGRFFSYRRATHAGEADYGRLISAIALDT